ncbi:MAG: hypothetical protein IT384_27960 [Deltaproteobacteria bacterium]|nr:hypothetical protein [Deltaproteobacteria bacterium]
MNRWRQTSPLLGAALISAACHRVDSLSLPPLESGGSIVLIATSGEAPVSLFAQDSGSELSLPVFSYTDDLELTALDYACPLESLGLAPGEQRRLPEPSDRTKLPPPRAAWTSRVESSGPSAWAPTIELDSVAAAAFQSIELPDDHLCGLYVSSVDVSGIRVPERSLLWTAFVLPLPEQRALIATQDGVFYLFDLTRREVTLPTIDVRDRSGGSTHAPSAAALRLSSGEIVLFGEDGRVARGTIEGGFVLDALRGPPKPRAAIATDDGAQIFVASGSHRWLPTGVVNATVTYAAITSSSIAVDVFDGREWKNLRRKRVGFLLPAPSFEWVAPDAWVAVGLSTGSIARYRLGGEIVEEPVPRIDLPPTIHEDLTLIRRTSDGSLVAGTMRRDLRACREEDRSGCFAGSGRLMLYGEMGWSAARGADLGATIDALQPFEDDVVMLGLLDLPFGERNQAYFWHRQTGICSHVQVLGTIEATHLVGPGRVLVSYRFSNRLNGIGLALISRERPILSCLPR